VINKKYINAFPNIIRKEIEDFISSYQKDIKISSIFFGGGTPSLMDPKFFLEAIDYIRNKFILESDAEITIEMNPGTITIEKVKEYRRAGINRVSVGVQSFFDDDLQFMTRIHNSSEAFKAIKMLSDAGFDNINIDLIFNLPGQTKEKWQQNLNYAIDLPVQHISAYSLIVERGTLLFRLIERGDVKIARDDYDADLYEQTIDFLTSRGFKQYEVSNFARPGFECRHNMAYWDYSEYFGFGPGAHSFYDNKRKWNYRGLTFYKNSVERGGLGTAGEEILTEDQMEREFLMLALRSTGIGKEAFKKKFGTEIPQSYIQYLKKAEKEEFVYENCGVFSLTAKGYAVCDEILINML